MTDVSLFYRHVGARIAAVRDGERKLTQEALASLVSLSRTSIANIERGRQQLLLHHFYQIAKALTVDPTDLLPPAGDEFVALDALLARLPDKERQWIRSTVAPKAKRK